MTDIFDDLDRITAEVVGDPITYTPAGGQPLTFNAFVENDDVLVGFGNTSGTVCDAHVQVRKIDVPVKPAKDSVFFLPRVGRSFNPKEATSDKTGRLWNIALKLIPGS